MNLLLSEMDVQFNLSLHHVEWAILRGNSGIDCTSSANCRNDCPEKIDF